MENTDFSPKFYTALSPLITIFCPTILLSTSFNKQTMGSNRLLDFSFSCLLKNKINRDKSNQSKKSD